MMQKYRKASAGKKKPKTLNVCFPMPFSKAPKQDLKTCPISTFLIGELLMVQWHERSEKNPSGGRRNTINAATKKLSARGGVAALTKTDTTVTKDNIEANKGLGNTTKTRALALKHANITDKKGKVAKFEIIAVKTNDANRLFARSNISTKGAIIRVKVEGSEKLAKVTSRPGQDGVVNAIFVE